MNCSRTFLTSPSLAAGVPVDEKVMSFVNKSAKLKLELEMAVVPFKFDCFLPLPSSVYPPLLLIHSLSVGPFILSSSFRDLV